MWKVKNNINEKPLGLFHEKVILLLFKFILDSSIKEISYAQSIIKSYSNFSEQEKKMLKILLKKKILKKQIEEIKKVYSVEKIMEIKEYYLYLWKSINLKNYNVEFKEVGVGIKELFIYFFETCFNCKVIWGELLSCKFSKEEFLENFRKENKLTVCPYCDIADTLLPGNSFIDHFIPKSTFPLLSMHPYNLIPICGSCNGQSGKSDNYIANIYGLYEIQIGDKIDFIINHPMYKIELETRDEKIKNYIELLKLDSKYSIDEVYEKSSKKIKGLYELICKVDDFNCIQLLDYLKKNKKNEQLYFLNKSMVNSYSEYKGSK